LAMKPLVSIPHSFRVTQEQFEQELQVNVTLA
jgi:predicted RNA-binding protein YlqC (UPF0109 family)